MARARILIVDDSETARGLLQMVVQAQDFDVETAADGAEALAAIQRHAPDLIVTDGVMPGIDGPTLFRRLKADPETRQIPVIALTSGDPGDWQATPDGPGPDGILEKSADVQPLLALLDQLLGA